MEHETLLDAAEPGPSRGLAGGPFDATQAVHLARFNVVEVEDIERAIATRLGVSRDYVAPEGFVVLPESDHRMRITWESSAVIEIPEFQAIVEQATAANERSVARVSVPEPRGPIARPRRKMTRRARRADPDEPS